MQIRVESRDGSVLVGRRLGEFVVREQLSAGGFGLVFRAEQPALAREAVIKVLHARLRASETVIQRFLREARLASRLDHPYAAHIYAFGAEPDGLMWIAMELVRGTPLDRLLEAKGAVSLERFVPLLERICQVVQTAHEQGIVHRDLKPANVMVLVRAGQLLPKLLDLGIAKLDDADPGASGEVPALVLDAARAAPAPAPAQGQAPPPPGVPASLADTAAPEPARPDARTLPVPAGAARSNGPITPADASAAGRLTEHGAVMGSPLYMAPEQWIDAATSDARTDIYALGVLSYEALTTRPPFAGATRMEIARAHATQMPKPLGDGFPPALDAVIARALAKRPEDRYASALELASAFRAASGIAEEIEGLPRLTDEVRAVALPRAPRPIAQAVGALHAARNAHQARDALWQLVRLAARLAGVIALAAHAHVGGAQRSQSDVTAALRRLRNRALPDAEWLALARELCAPFAELRAAYPVPELIDLVEDPASPLARLIELGHTDAGPSDAHVRELLATAMPLAEALLGALAFLGEYQLVVPFDHGAVRWIGAGQGERAHVRARGPALVARQPALLDAAGAPVVSLWPFVQLHAPAPGVPEQLFFLEGKGRRGARMTALPEPFELEDEAAWEAVGGLVADDTGASSSAEEVCPYPGLLAFTANDADRFFGRERETEAFVNRLRAQPLLAVVGPSGAGKGSFVQAGVLPALPDDWRVITVRPGASPLVNLSTRLAAVADPQVLLAELAHDPAALGDRLRAREGPGMTLLVVDQLEELFTLCDDPAERERLAEALVRAARSADEPVRVVLTLRDDFLIHAEALAALRSRLAPALHLLTTPGPADLRRILVEPLRQAGYELDDPALADEMVEALAGARSPLALLSFTCSMLWDLRDRRFRQLSRKAYASLGGVGGALAQHAEGTLAGMRPEEQRLVREVFRHAVTADGTRAVLERGELDRVLGGGAAAVAVTEKLIGARLLVSSDGPTGGEQIEIAHEALILAWPRLVTWRREDAEGARMRDQLRAAAKQWDERGRPAGLLWRGDALAEYRHWRTRYPGALGSLDEAFAAASLADAARSARRRKALIAGSIGVLSIGVVVLVVLNARVARQRERASEHAAAAEEAATKLSANLMKQYADQGRRYVLAGDPLPGLAYLDAARALGAAGPAHDLVVAFAAQAIGGKLHELRHDGWVHGAAFSPDGTRVATAGKEGTRVWDAATGKVVLDLPYEHGALRSRFTREGDAIVEAAPDGAVTVWDVATRRERHEHHAGRYLQDAVLSPDGQRIATVGLDDVVELWDLTAGARSIKLQATEHAPADIQIGRPASFSPSGELLAVGDNRGVVRVWDVAKRALIARNLDHRDQINQVRFTSDGKRVLVASNDATASLFDAGTGKRVFVVRHRQRVNAAELSPDGAYLATGSNDRTAVLWDARTGEVVRTLSGHTGGVNALAFRPDGKQLATGADDRDVMVWDVATGRREVRLIGHRAAIRTLAYDASGRRLVSTSFDDQRAIVWAPKPAVDATRVEGHDAAVYSVDVSPDGTRVATGGDDGLARVWDLATGASLLERRYAGGVRRVRFSPDGSRLAVVGLDQVVHVHDARTGAVLRSFTGHENRVFDVAWLADGTRLVTGSFDGSARIWSMARDEPLYIHRGHTGPVRAISVAPDGTAAATIDDDGVQLWDLATGAVRARWPFTGGVGVESDPTGRYVLACSSGSARAWRLDDRTPALELNDVGDLMSARWSSDGRFVVTASIDATTRIWDARGGELLAVLSHGDHVPVFRAAFSDDGRHVVSGSQDGSFTIWRLPPTIADAAALVRCSVPYRVAEIGLVQVQLDPRCTSSSPALHTKDQRDQNP